MSTSKTPNYHLHAWTAGDDFRFHEINENFAALDGSLRAVTGTYAGTGGFGQQDPNTLTFPLAPRLLIIQGGNWLGFFMKDSPSAMTFGGSGEIGTQQVTWEDKTVSWYVHEMTSATGGTYAAETDGAQLNDAAVTYRYLAVG